MSERNSAQVGQVIATPHTCGGKPRLRGTRWPTYIAWDYITAGYSVDEVLMAFPHLDRIDVLVAFAFEQGRHYRKGKPIRELIP